MRPRSRFELTRQPQRGERRNDGDRTVEEQHDPSTLPFFFVGVEHGKPLSMMPASAGWRDASEVGASGRLNATGADAEAEDLSSRSRRVVANYRESLELLDETHRRLRKLIFRVLSVTKRAEIRRQIGGAWEAMAMPQS